MHSTRMRTARLLTVSRGLPNPPWMQTPPWIETDPPAPDADPCPLMQTPPVNSDTHV